MGQQEVHVLAVHDFSILSWTKTMQFLELPSPLSLDVT